MASAQRLMEEGACVVLCDIDRTALAQAEATLAAQSRDNVAAVWVDVTDEGAVASLFEEAAWRFGGIDISVSNAAAIASAAPIEDTTLALWERNIDILATGYFLVSRQAVRLLKAQNLGGSIVFIGSKNALAASPGASAYCTAKAAELHLHAPGASRSNWRRSASA